MTPKRKQALQFFHDRGEVGWFAKGDPSRAMLKAMMADGQLQKHNNGEMRLITYSLTDKGRKDLHEVGT